MGRLRAPLPPTPPTALARRASGAPPSGRSAVVSLHQRTLLGAGEPEIDAGAAFERIRLDDESWVDVAREWLHGADSLLDLLVDQVEWKQGKRWMYERMVDDPRLSRWFPAGEPVPHPVLEDARRELGAHYDVRFGSVGLNYYRDGADSVAWHADRELRELEDTRVAILTLGARRPFLIRPKGGGSSIDIKPGSGDLLVMGGRCQMDWEHNVPKSARVTGPRISCSWRWMRSPAAVYDELPLPPASRASKPRRDAAPRRRGRVAHSPRPG
jgi:alkylated DNA repair dioxygenase AlkB